MTRGANQDSGAEPAGRGALRPKARLLRTLGSDLISSDKVALIELVKNSYDADAGVVLIRFRGPLNAGEGGIEVNRKSYETYFHRATQLMQVRMPMENTDTLGKFKVIARVHGGGISGQAGALRHGIARALVKFDEALRGSLRKGGFLTRDPREKESKKYGRKRARRGFQWTKR